MVSAAKEEVFDRLRKARDLHLENKIVEARNLLESILQEQDSRNAEAHWRLGLIFEEEGDVPKALREYRSAARNGVVDARSMEYDSLRKRLMDFEQFDKKDLKEFMTKISEINGTVHRVAMDYIIENFEVVKKELVLLWKRQSISESDIVAAFENLKGTFATPGLISNLLFLKNREQYNICVSILVLGLSSIGLFSRKSISDGHGYLEYNSVINSFKLSEQISPEAVDWLLTYVGRLRENLNPDIWKKTEPKMQPIQRGLSHDWWIELTHVREMPDRTEGEYSLGKALWSPQKDKGGKDIYSNMRKVRKGDIVLHLNLSENAVDGVSIVATEYDSSFKCLAGTPWDDGTGTRPGYLIKLKDYEPLAVSLRKDEILDEKNRAKLLSILDQYKNIFYNRGLDLNQGAYITRLPEELITIINDAYRQKTGKDLPNYSPPTSADQILHLIYKIAWHPGGYKGGFCGNADSVACEAFDYIKKGKQKQPCSKSNNYCGDENAAFSDNGWRVTIHPRPEKKLKQLTDGKSLLFLIAPLDKYKSHYRLVGFYTIKQKRSEDGRLTLEGDRKLSSKFDLKNEKLVYDNEELKKLIGISKWRRRPGSYEFISGEVAANVLNQVYEIHRTETSADPDVRLEAMATAIKRLKVASGGLGPMAARARSIRESINGLVKNEPEYAEVTKPAFAHLVAGKNLVFYGPPATSKTYLAKKICKYGCGEDDFCFHTANAEWSYFDIVGGQVLQGNQTVFKKGILLEATEKCRYCLAKTGRSSWIIIDELNRANLDLAFGKIFTQLDIDYRDRPLETIIEDGSSHDYSMPLGFRVLATMNTYDKALLFSLGYAFMRRFAFIPMHSLIKRQEKFPSTDEQTQLPEDIEHIVSSSSSEMIKSKIVDTVFDHFSKQNGMDKAFIYSELEVKEKDQIDKILKNLKIGDFEILDLLIYVAYKITNEGLVEIGHAILFDAAKFIVAYSLLFPEETDARFLLDDVMVSYFLPQLEYYMPKLRKAKVFGEEKYKHGWTQLISVVGRLNLPKTMEKLRNAEEAFRVIH